MSQSFPLSARANLEFAFAHARNSFRGGATSDAATGLIRRIDLHTDNEIQGAQDSSPKKLDCKPGCDYCCHRPVQVTLPELAAIVDLISKEFTDEQKLALSQRLSTYNEAAEPYRNGMLDLSRATCPMLVDHLCSIYPDRPLFCRMANSFDREVCKAIMEHPHELIIVPSLEEQSLICAGGLDGLRRGLAAAQVNNGMYELGLAVSILLADPEKLQAVLTNSDTLPQPTSSESTKKFDPLPDDAHGQPSHDAAATAARELIHAGKISESEELLTGGTFAQALSRLTVPALYQSEDEILEQRARYERVLDNLLEMEFDPREAFNSLLAHNTFNLAYQGLGVKDTLARHGQLLVDKISSRALPHLTAPIDSPRKEGKIRLGYISTKLRYHNGAQWALGWFQHHSDAFEKYAFNVGDLEDPVSLEFKKAADHYYHLTGNIQKAAEFIRALDLDVLIFTDIGMSGMDYQYASLRLARVQCTAWGHPVTSGLPTIDYYISSEYMEPEDGDAHYTEKLVRLPRTGLCYPKTKFSASEKSRTDLGLPDGFLPLMGQNLQKWVPKDDYLLEEIAKRFTKPIVFVAAGRPAWTEIFESRMRKAKIPYIMVPRLNGSDYNRLIELSDVSLDPPAWSGGNTSIEALTVRTPVISLPGAYMRGRHSLAFHKVAGSDALVASSPEEYVEFALDRNRQRETMRKANPDALYDDRGVVAALDEFVLSVASA